MIYDKIDTRKPSTPQKLLRFDEIDGVNVNLIRPLQSALSTSHLKSIHNGKSWTMGR